MVVTISLLFAIGTAMALPLNDRPVAIGSSGEQPLGGLTGIFASIGATTYAADPINTQSAAAIFTNDGSGGSVATFIISIAGNQTSNESGLYKYGDTSKLVPIFQNVTAGQAPQAQALVTYFANGSVVVTAGAGAESSSVVKTGTYLNFGNEFGFYIKGPGGTFFTEDDQNGGNPQALVYQGNDKDTIAINGFNSGTFTNNEFIFAFEDLPWASTDRDFNDLVYLVESISPVPEPTSLILLGSGLACAGLYRRLRRKSS